MYRWLALLCGLFLVACGAEAAPLGRKLSVGRPDPGLSQDVVRQASVNRSSCLSQSEHSRHPCARRSDRPKQDNGEVTHLQNTAKNKLDNPALLCILCI